MLVYRLSEDTAALRRVPIHCVDLTNGYEPETGEAGGQPQIAMVGGTPPAFANTSAALVAIGNGTYYVELTAPELATLGPFVVRYKSANTREVQVACQCVSYDPYDAVSLGISRLDAAITSRSTVTTAEVLTQALGALNTAIPGGPTADSINERVVQLDTNFTATQAGYLNSYLDAAVSTRATPADANAQMVDVIKTVVMAEQSPGAPPSTPTMEQALMYLFMAWRNKATATSSLLQYHNDAGTALCKATLSDNTVTFTREELVAP